MTQPTFHSRYDDRRETLNWGRVLGIAFAVTVQASLFMMLLVPPSVQNTDQDQEEKPTATIIEPPPPPPPPPQQIKTPPPKEVPPPPRVNTPPPPPTPPVISQETSPMSPPAPPPAPPAPPAPAVDIGASVDITFMKNNPPDYPREEMNAGVTGVVVLLVTVNAAGEPVSVAVEKSSHNRNLDRAAKDAAMKWRFNPGKRNGSNVGDVVRVPVEFKL